MSISYLESVGSSIQPEISILLASILRKHFRLIEAIAIVIIATGAILELRSVRSYEQRRSQLIEELRRSDDATRFRRAMLELNGQISTLSWRSQKWMPEKRIEGELMNIMVNHESTEAQVFAERATALAAVRSAASLDPLDGQEEVTNQIRLRVEMYKKLPPWTGDKDIDKKTAQMMREIPMSSEEVDSSLWRMENRTASQLAWLRSRYQAAASNLKCNTLPPR